MIIGSSRSNHLGAQGTFKTGRTLAHAQTRGLTRHICTYMHIFIYIYISIYILFMYIYMLTVVSHHGRWPPPLRHPTRATYTYIFIYLYLYIYIYVCVYLYGHYTYMFGLTRGQRREHRVNPANPNHISGSGLTPTPSAYGGLTRSRHRRRWSVYSSTRHQPTGHVKRQIC